MSWATHLGAALLAAAVSWHYTATSYKLDAAELSNEQLTGQSVKTYEAVQKLYSEQAQLAKDLKESKNASDKVNAALLGLRTDVSGLRHASSELSRRVSAGTSEDVREYATLCGTLLGTVAEAGRRLSEGGAGIANAADEHAAHAKD